MRLVLFDCDGTLVDSQNFISTVMTMAFEAVGLEPPERQKSLSIVGLSLLEAMIVLAGNDAPVEALVAAYKDNAQALRLDKSYEAPLYDGALECLAQLKKEQQTILGVATGKNIRGLLHLIEVHDLGDHFLTLQTADNAPSKPHPAMIEQACAEMGIAIEDTIMIGDTSFDMDMAKNAGAKAIGVSWGYHSVATLKNSQPSAIVDSFDELQNYLSDPHLHDIKNT